MSRPKSLLATFVFIGWIGAVCTLCTFYPVAVFWLLGAFVVASLVWFIYDTMREL